MEKDKSSDHFSKLCSDDQIELTNFYRRSGKYYTDICREFSTLLFNWAFFLNTGGLTATIGYLGAKNTRTFLMLIPGICFLLGILLIITASNLEKLRFEARGTLLDKAFTDLINGIISEKDFLNKSRSPCSLRVYVVWLEIFSYILFFSGIISFLVLFFFSQASYYM